MNGNHASFRRLSMQALAATQFAAVLTAQVAWEERSPKPAGRVGHALAYDLLRGRTVMFGGASGTPWLADTWEWDGAAWTNPRPANSPPARSTHALAYDGARGRTVLFGGSGSNTLLSDTWEWDGVTWLQRAPAQSPPARSDHALAYDIGRGRTVLFGGLAQTWLSDTWEWDGTNWLQRTPAQSPPPRCDHALAYDVSRLRTVLFGGAFFLAPTLADTWEWDGSNWLQRTPALSPPARARHALAHDVQRGRTVLFGGGVRETWEWDGTNWTQVAPAIAPPQSSGPLAYDLSRGRTVLFGGTSPIGELLSVTWEWDGTTWSDRTPAISTPVPRSNPALAYDSLRARTVLFGGFNNPLSTGIALTDTWEWDGTNWFLQTPATIPPARKYSPLAFDAQRGFAVLFGGFATPVAVADTWEWNGIDWSLRAPANSPPPRYWHALAYDSARGRTILFGGQGPLSSPLADTWEWDGLTWLQRTPAQIPPARLASALAYDAARARTVLFGGTNSNPRFGALFADTWEWDGTNWSQRVSTHAPPARSDHALAYDSARGRTVLFGGLWSYFNQVLPFSDTWEWDGGDWLQRTPTQDPPARGDHGLAFDARRGRTVLFGTNYTHEDIWEYGPMAAGSYEPFGAGCTGSAGTASLGARDGLRPYPGNAVTVDVAPVPANAAVLVSVGLSRTQWSSFTLPLSLAGLGMPGCTLYASPDVSLLLAANGSTATWTFHIPNNQGLVGLQFYNQAFVVDPPANTVGITTTNAAEGLIGSK
jgi:hypothetical protein